MRPTMAIRARLIELFPTNWMWFSPMTVPYSECRMAIECHPWIFIDLDHVDELIINRLAETSLLRQSSEKMRGVRSCCPSESLAGAHHSGRYGGERASKVGSGTIQGLSHYFRDRECLRDQFDLPGLNQRPKDIGQGSIRASLNSNRIPPRPSRRP